MPRANLAAGTAGRHGHESVATTDGSGATFIRLCGELQVRIRGTDVTAELRGPQPRMLFACLALNRGRTVSRDELIDVLWPINPPRSPGAGLNVVLTRVRNAVGG